MSVFRGENAEMWFYQGISLGFIVHLYVCVLSPLMCLIALFFFDILALTYGPGPLIILKNILS